MQILFPEVVNLFSIQHGGKGSDLLDQVPEGSGPPPPKDGWFPDVPRTLWPALPQATAGTSTWSLLGKWSSESRSEAGCGRTGRQPSVAALWRVPAPELGWGGEGALTGPTVSYGALDVFACTALTVFVFVFIIGTF